MIIVITHAGNTSEHSLVLDDVDLDDAYIKALSEEIKDLPRGTLHNFVVDRMPTAAGGEPRMYVRPKVPFGGATILVEETHQQNDKIKTMQLEIAIEALLQYASSPTSSQRARDALTEIAALDEEVS